MGRMLSIRLHIFHPGHYGSEHYVPVFRGIIVDTDLNALQALYHFGKGQESRFEIFRNTATQFSIAFKFETYYMLYHHY